MGRKVTSGEVAVAAVALALALFGVGVVVGKLGFRIDAESIGNVYGFSPHEWGIFLSGIISSVVGGLVGGLVAIWVLRRTLEHQSDIHKDQMRAQRSEATKQRATAAAAGILSSLWLVNRASNESEDEMRKQVDAAILAIHGLRLEKEHNALAKSLSIFIATVEGSPEHVIDNDENRQTLIRATGAVARAVTDWFQDPELGEVEDPLERIHGAARVVQNFVSQPEHVPSDTGT